MSGDVTPESLRALADYVGESDIAERCAVVGDPIMEDTADALRAAADRITELEAALVEREATIAAAPHLATCGAVWKLRAEWPNCTCWKSAAPGDALTAHDAEVKAIREVK